MCSYDKTQKRRAGTIVFQEVWAWQEGAVDMVGGVRGGWWAVRGLGERRQVGCVGEVDTRRP